MSSIQFPNGQVAAVSLTYDDAIPTHYTLVKDLLGEYGFNATFYTHLKSPLLDDFEAWQNMARLGHEIGNHTIFHPCIKHEGKSWLADCFNLKNYDSTRFITEIEIANKVLKLIDGKDGRTYGNTCHNNWLGTGESSVKIETLLPNHFVAARGESGQKKMIDPQAPNFYNLGTIGIDRKPFEEIEAMIDEAVASKRWVIFTMHNVAEDGLAISPEVHDQLIKKLSKQHDSIWTAPVREIASYLKIQNCD